MFIIAYPDTLIEYKTLDEAWAAALQLSKNMEQPVGVYEVTPRTVALGVPLPPPEPKRHA